MFRRRKAKDTRTASGGTQSQNVSPIHEHPPLGQPPASTTRTSNATNKANVPSSDAHTPTNTSPTSTRNTTPGRTKPYSQSVGGLVDGDENAAAASVAAISRLLMESETNMRSPERRRERVVEGEEVEVEETEEEEEEEEEENQDNDKMVTIHQSDLHEVLHRLRQAERKCDGMSDTIAKKDEEIHASQQQLERLSTMIVELTMSSETNNNEARDDQELLGLLTSAKMELATKAMDHEQHLSRLKREHLFEKRSMTEEIQSLNHDLEEAFVALDMT